MDGRSLAHGGTQRRLRRSLVALLALVLTSTITAVSRPATAQSSGYRIVWDDFQNGFSTEGEDARWFYFAAGPYVGDDGIVDTSNGYLNVRASGTNASTGEPAFVRTIAQEDDNPYGLPGGLDHVKWLAYMNHFSAKGYPGFDAVPGQELACETVFSGRSYGTAGHPFGNAVADAADDLRLGSVAMNTIDFETMMVFDFFVTNKRIYAFYERLPFARGQLGNYASFSFQIPVAPRDPGDVHALKIAYNKSAGTVRWLINRREVYRVSRLGHLIDRQYMTIDHGGLETLVSPDQLACGMGMFTLLDGARPGTTGLVRLASTPGTYFDVGVGQPAPASFVDDESLETSRLFGQGTEMSVGPYAVSSTARR